MNVGDCLDALTKRLEAAGIGTARLDALVLLEDILNTNRAQILANLDLLISKSQQKRLEATIARRVLHEPLAYIRNKTEFYGRNFFIDQRVLEPRSESETMINLLKSSAVAKNSSLIDVGTGSGALAVTAKLELPDANVWAVDNDKNCLTVARKNAHALKANVHFQLSDLLARLPDNQLRDAVLLCNLPYVPDDFHINQAATHEPRTAIFGGHDGLDLYRRLFEQLVGKQARPLIILTESLPPQHQQLATIAISAGYVLEQTEDFIQLFRTDTANLGL